MMLQTQRKAYKITFSNNEKHVVFLSEEPNREMLKRNKVAMKLDGIMMDFSYCVTAGPVRDDDLKVDGAMGRARDQLGPIAAVAMERVRYYEEKMGKKMLVSDIIKRMEFFLKHGNDPDRFDKRFIKLYVDNGGEKDAIGPFAKKKTGKKDIIFV